MKLIAIVLVATALAACSNNAAPEQSPSEAATIKVSAGSYDITQADGSRLISVLNANGTYTDTVNGAVTESGTWADKDDGATCFTPTDDSDAKAQCYTFSAPAEDGSFTATPSEGDPIKVKKIA